MLAAVRAVAAGDSLLSPSVTRRVIAELIAHAPASTPAGSPDWVAELTDREAEVLQLLARGSSNAEIASTLTISHETVKTHIARLLSKTGSRDRLQAVVAAYDAGVVVPRHG